MLHVLIFDLYANSCALYLSNICGHTRSCDEHQPAAAIPPLVLSTITPRRSVRVYFPAKRGRGGRACGGGGAGAERSLLFGSCMSFRDNILSGQFTATSGGCACGNFLDCLGKIPFAVLFHADHPVCQYGQKKDSTPG